MPRSGARRVGYLLLEVVVATGLLVVGLGVIGAQLHESRLSIRQADLRTRAMNLAEMQLSYLDLGLIEFDSVDDVQEEEFGPRYPSFGWRLTLDETSQPDLFLLKLDILHGLRESPEDDFDFDEAEDIHTVYALRMTPRALDLGAEFGLTEEEFDDLNEQLAELAIPGFDDASAFNPRTLADTDIEKLIELLPLLSERFPQLLGNLTSLPPEVLAALEAAGLGIGGDEDGEAEGDGAPSGGQGGR